MGWLCQVLTPNFGAISGEFRGNLGANWHSRRAVNRGGVRTAGYNPAMLLLVRLWLVRRVIKWLRAVIEAELDEPCRTCALDLLDIAIRFISDR
jgi:hypothetical protein